MELQILLIITIAILFIVVVCSSFKWHLFLALLIAALFTGLAVGLPLKDIAKTADEGFGTMMTHIGLVVVLGTLIGTVLEKSGATLRIANAIIRFFGKDKPALAVGQETQQRLNRIAGEYLNNYLRLVCLIWVKTTKKNRNFRKVT